MRTDIKWVQLFDIISGVLMQNQPDSQVSGGPLKDAPKTKHVSGLVE